MTASPPLPTNLNHLHNGHRVFFYRNRGMEDRTPMVGHVIGQGRDPKSGLARLTIVPRDPQTMIHEITRGGVVYRTVNAVFPSLEMLNAHAAWMEEASVEEIAEWTRQIISLFDMISNDPVG